MDVESAMNVESADAAAKDSAADAEKNVASLVDGDRPRDTVVYGSVGMFLFLR